MTAPATVYATPVLSSTRKCITTSIQYKLLRDPAYRKAEQAARGSGDRPNAAATARATANAQYHLSKCNAQ